MSPGGGGHWPRKGVWGCAAVMTPFFQASRRSLAYQFTIIAPLICPPFSNFRKFFHFQPCFGQNFSSQDANFPNFCSLDPSFFKENPLPRPYFWKPVWHIPTKKKLSAPPPPGTVSSWVDGCVKSVCCLPNVLVCRCIASTPFWAI